MSTPISSPITSRPPQVEFTNRFVQPPSELYVFRDDILIVRVGNAVTGARLRIEMRLLSPSGIVIPQRFEIDPPSDRTFNTSVFSLAEGFLLGVAIFPSAGTLRRGQVFVELSLGRGSENGFIILHHLTSDYVSDNGRIGWPGGRILSSLEGPGHLRSLVGTDPAVTLNISETVPAGARWRLVSMRFRLVTDANVAARRVVVEVVDDASQQVWQIPSRSTQAASATETYFAAVVGFWETTLLQTHILPMPTGLMLLQGWRIRTLLQNVQAGDDFEAPRLWLEEWLEA